MAAVAAIALALHVARATWAMLEYNYSGGREARPEVSRADVLVLNLLGRTTGEGFDRSAQLDWRRYDRLVMTCLLMAGLALPLAWVDRRRSRSRDRWKARLASAALIVGLAAGLAPWVVRHNDRVAEA